MALSVTTDLTVLTTAEAYASPPWYKIGVTAPATEPDFYVQGSNCISLGIAAAATKGMVFDNVTPINFVDTGANKDKLVYIWMKSSCPGLCATRAGGGLTVRLCTTSATDGYRQWYIDGSDTLVAIEGWTCYIVDPQSAGSVADVGSYNANSVRYFGGTMTTIGSAKGQNFGVDQIAIGRGEIYVSGTVATAGSGFKEIATVDFGTGTNRWGIITEKQGIYFVKGKIIIGHATANTTFSSYNETVIWETPAYKGVTNVVKTIPDASVGGTVGADGLTTYNGLAFIGGSGTTTIDFGVIVGTTNGRSGSSFTCVTNAGLTTPGKTKAWVNVSDATIGLSLYSSAFSGFEGGVDLYGTGVDDDDCFNTSFIGCGRLRTNMEIRNCNILNSVAAVDDGAYLWESTTNLQSSLFINNSRAIVFESTTGTPFAFTNLTFGSNAYDIRNESLGTIVINATGSYAPTYENAGSGSETTVNAGVNATVTVKTLGGDNINDAQVLVLAASGGPMPVNVTVTIARSGSTATVTHAAHGMATNDKVQIDGANQWEYNGVFTITKIDNDSYSYAVSGTPETPATGTIKATYAALSGVTVSGQIGMSRTFTSSQPISGRVRKATGSPFYKTSNIVGTIDSVSGFAVTVQMIPDE